ncbi:hypothetical protein AALF16_24035 [Bacillus cereus]|uniref:hypothetical protein n=1 Tax=Bacillus cereus TaxID=1396 RepID=UPI0035703B9A
MRVFFPQEPTSPQDPFTPGEPIHPIIINTWGINFVGVIQQGNTVLHGQFYPQEPISPQDPA